jgi:site-specific DNA-methyltransferase (adenine-specific)
MIQLLHGDCLELMKDIPDKSIDMILCDLPYGTTSKNKWDSIIPFDSLWKAYKRIIKDKGAILLFGQPPFSSELIVSNKEMFRYEWIWQKTLPQGFLNANRMPLRATENVSVFYKKLPTYNPQMKDGKPYDKGIRKANCTTNYGNFGETIAKNKTGKRFPTNVLAFSNSNHQNIFHPTQKPVVLLEYLIKTYTNEGETVLDNCMGSGSTGVACVNLNRNFVGMELEEEYFEIAKERIYKAESEDKG